MFDISNPKLNNSNTESVSSIQTAWDQKVSDILDFVTFEYIMSYLEEWTHV
jgi:hypothetical protein